MSRERLLYKNMETEKRCLSLVHPIANAGLGEDVGGVVGGVAQVADFTRAVSWAKRYCITNLFIGSRPLAHQGREDRVLEQWPILTIDRPIFEIWLSGLYASNGLQHR